MSKSYSENNLLSLIKSKWHLIILFFIGIISFTLNFYAISKYGTGNEYYAAAIKSMTQSFHNFFFVSFDPSGMVSVDKPPLGLWMQAISCLIFGYHGWAMLLPQALAGTGSCIMIYILSTKHFGRKAGLLSSFIFALVPSVVVASRNNTMDMQLIFVLLIATWFLFKSIEKNKRRYLFAAGAMVGVGFNIKMLEAYMILPGFILVYLFFAKGTVIKRFLTGIIASLIMIVVSFSWVLAVDLYPSDSRPYVDSSTNNTVLELIIGHNGMERIYGQSKGGGTGGNMGRAPSGEDQNGNMGTPPSGTSGEDQNGNMGTPPSGTSGEDQNGNMGTPPSGNMGEAPSGMDFSKGNSGGGMGGDEIGNASIFRMWSSNIYGQASWLIIFCVFAILVFVKKINIKKLTLKQGVFTYWILWFATMFGFFSFAGFYHRYYLCMFAPAIAVLSGVGLLKMIEEFKAKSKIKQFVLPIALISTMGIEIKYVYSYSQLRSSLLPVMVIATIGAVLLMIKNYFKTQKSSEIAMIIVIIISLLAAPFYWALTPVMYVMNTTMPAAGPENASSSGMGMGGQGAGQDAGQDADQDAGKDEQSTSSGLEKYLVANYKEGSFLVVSQRANTVAQYIIDTGLPAYAYGGFLGSDNSLTLDKLKELVAEGKVTYFLLSGQGGGGESSNSEIETFVKENATLIDATEYGGSSSQSTTNKTESTTNESSTSKTESTTNENSNSKTESTSDKDSMNRMGGGNSGTLYCFNK